MKVNLFSGLLIPLALASAPAQTQKSPPINWSDTTRNVYIDNELDRDAQVLTAGSPSRIALISAKLDSAYVLDVSQHTVSTTAKDAFRFGADRTTATSDSSAAMKAIGRFTRTDGPVYSFVADGKPVLIRAHPGATGELSVGKLWEAVPVWHAVMMHYQPNSEAVTRIKANEQDTTVTLAFGTWCPDSKNYIPRLLKALDSASNARIHLKLIGIDNQFREPVASVQPLRIINVPTVIVERGGREIGRIIETPASPTMEEDLAAILGGRQLVHNGRWERGPLAANGVYSYLDRAGKEAGAEFWELFNTAEGGYLVHSRITTGNLTTEVFHRVDAGRRPTFAEVTKRQGDEVVRTRFNIDGTTLTARTRGSASGVITQTVEVPARFFLSSPAVAAQGLVQASTGTHYQISTYATPLGFDKWTATLAATSCDAGGEETIRVPAGEFRALHVIRKIDGDISRWWVHPRLGIPIKGVNSSFEYVLKSLEVKGLQQ